MHNAQEQFVNDYTTVVDNDRNGYEFMKGLVESKKTLEALAGTIQHEFESYIEAVASREELAGRNTGALMIREMLLGWGDDSFRAIARHYIDMVEELDTIN
jgi:hypothetical protein